MQAPALGTPANVASANALRMIPLLVATSVLYAYMASVYVYKTWYIATAFAALVVIMLSTAGALCTRGVIRATVPVVLYFITLAGSAAFAAEPQVTLLWVAIDSIELIIFILFYIAARNAPAGAVTSSLLTVVIPATVVSLVMYRIDPNISRLAHYSLPILPLVVPFAFARMATRRPKWRPAAVLALAFALLLASRSRSPLLAAIIMAGLATIAFRANVFDLVRRITVGAVLGVMVVGALLWAPVTRQMVLTMYVRLSYKTILWRDFYIPAEAKDTTRVAINDLGFALIAESFPFGIGYMNFIHASAAVLGYPANLHSSYMTWATEGGLACVLVVAVMGWLHVRGLRAYMRRSESAEERAYAKALLIGTVGVLLMAVFHQMHQTPAFFLLLGLGAACRQTARERVQLHRNADPA